MLIISTFCLSRIVLSTLTAISILSTLYHLYLIHVKDRRTGVATGSNMIEGSAQNSSKDKVTESSTNLALRLENRHNQSSSEPARSIVQQFVLAFSVVANTKRLLQSPTDQRDAPLNGIQLLLIFFLFAGQAFSFGVLVTPQMLRSWIDTVPYQLLNSSAYWFVRTPGTWVDGLMFIM